MTLTSGLVFGIIVFGAYLILFEIGIPNLVCGSILGWWSVVYYLRITVTLNLTSYLVFRLIVSRALSIILYEVGIQSLVCECILGWWSFLFHVWFTVTLTSDLVSRISIKSDAYLLFSLG